MGKLWKRRLCWKEDPSHRVEIRSRRKILQRDTSGRFQILLRQGSQVWWTVPAFAVSEPIQDWS